MNFQQLDHFLALAETGSFSRASEKVHVTQPALSRSIQTLEQELGLPLIDRVGKRNELTPFGVAVLARAKRISSEGYELKRLAALMADGIAGTIRIGVGSAPSALFAGPLLIHVMQNYPKVRLQLLAGGPELHLASLRARTVDALILTYRAVPPREDLRIEVLPSLRSGFVCRSGHPLLDHDRVGFDELASYPLISTAVSDDVSRTLIERYGDSANPHRWLQASSEEIGSLMEVVRSTDAVFLGVLASTRSYLDRGEVAEIALAPASSLVAQFAFVTLESRGEAPALEIVRSFCKSLAAAESER